MNFFESYEGILRVFLSAVLAYITLILFIRMFGKRSTSKMNNYDWIVTLAMASILASTIVSKSLPFVEGVVAIFTLLVLQYGLTWFSTRFDGFANIVHASPTLLLYKGELLKDAMNRERISEREILAKMREQGVCDFDCVDAVVLESDGEISIVCCSDDNDIEDGVILERLDVPKRDR